MMFVEMSQIILEYNMDIFNKTNSGILQNM